MATKKKTPAKQTVSSKKTAKKGATPAPTSAKKVTKKTDMAKLFKSPAPKFKKPGNVLPTALTAVAAPAVTPAAPEARRPAPAATKKLGVSGTHSDRLRVIRATAKKINDRYKSEIIVPASEASTNAYLRRPCGVMPIDIDTGGGLPAGTLNTLSGLDNSGKSTLLYKYYAYHQKLYGEDSSVLLVNTEANIDYWMARRVGWVIPLPWAVIDAEQKNRKERKLPPLTNEEIDELRREVGTNYIVNPATGEEALDVLLQLLSTHAYGIAGLDSYEGLIPEAEAELDSLGDNARQAPRAALISKFLLHYGPISRQREHFTTTIFTCQVRSNRKKAEMQAHMAKYAKDWAETVPYPLRHWRQLNLTLWSGGKIKKDGKDGKVVLGKQVNWEIAKGKSGTHDNILGDTPYFYDERCFDDLRTVFEQGIRFGRIVEGTKGFTLYDEHGVADDYLRDISSVDEFINAMASDFQNELVVRKSTGPPPRTPHH